MNDICISIIITRIIIKKQNSQVRDRKLFKSVLYLLYTNKLFLDYEIE